MNTGGSQRLQTAQQSDILQALAEERAEGQCLQACLHVAQQLDMLQTLVNDARGQCPQTAWQRDTLQALVEERAEVNVCRLLGNTTPCELRVKSRPKVSVCRLLASVTPCKLVEILVKGQGTQASQRSRSAG